MFSWTVLRKWLLRFHQAGTAWPKPLFVKLMSGADVDLMANTSKLYRSMSEAGWNLPRLDDLGQQTG